MPDTTSNLALPVLAAAQAQKHVTLNEALIRLDALVQASAISRTIASEPASPADGALYILPAGKTGAHWSGMSNGALAVYQDGVWDQIQPREGWLVFVRDTDSFVWFTGAAWQSFSPSDGRVVGEITNFAGAAAPALWLLCYGQAISRTTYAALFAAIGTAFGAGDGSTTFNVPDLRGRVVAGKDNMGGVAASRLSNSGTGNPGIDGTTLGASGGVDRHALTSDQMPTHIHVEKLFQGNGDSGSNGYRATAANSGSGTAGSGTNVTNSNSISSAGGSEAHPNAQPTLVLNKIIYAGV